MLLDWQKTVFFTWQGKAKQGKANHRNYKLLLYIMLEAMLDDKLWFMSNSHKNKKAFSCFWCKLFYLYIWRFERFSSLCPKGVKNEKNKILKSWVDFSISMSPSNYRTNFSLQAQWECLVHYSVLEAVENNFPLLLRWGQNRSIMVMMSIIYHTNIYL